MKGSGGIKFDRGQVRQDNLEGRGRVQRGGELECTKKVAKKATYLAFGDASWGLSPHIIHFLES